MKKPGRSKSTGDVMHIYLGTAQGNSLCSYLYLKLAKMSCFSFVCVSLFFYKIREQEGGTDSNVGGRESGCTSERGEVAGERDRRMNMVSTRYTYVCKCTNDTC
jgi:hypothetical protein